MEEEKYVLTPKGIAVISLLQSGLITDINDQRIEGFWTLFQQGMIKAGYTPEGEDEENTPK